MSETTNVMNFEVVAFCFAICFHDTQSKDEKQWKCRAHKSSLIWQRY